jgi:hypothetical protein
MSDLLVQRLLAVFITMACISPLQNLDFDDEAYVLNMFLGQFHVAYDASHHCTTLYNIDHTFAIFHTSLTSMFIYCRHKSVVTKPHHTTYITPHREEIISLTLH